MLSTFIFNILLEGKGELSLLKLYRVVLPLGFVLKTPPVSVPNHLLLAPSIAIAFTGWSPNNFLAIPSSRIITGSALLLPLKTPVALEKTTNPFNVPNQILLLLSTATVLTFGSGNDPEFTSVVSAVFWFVSML